ncbi:MAG: PD40 domain-containing protein [Terrimicrobiaceae bacterium]
MTAASPSTFPRIPLGTLDEHSLGVSWSADGKFLVSTPSEGRIAVHAADGLPEALLPGHPGGNGLSGWHPRGSGLVTFGADGRALIYSPPFRQPVVDISFGSGWAEVARWSPTGKFLAAAVGKNLHLADTVSGKIQQSFGPHRSTILDFAWNPASEHMLAVAGAGGVTVWKTGSVEPEADWEWGEASHLVSWSPCGRWMVSCEQSSAVHLVDADNPEPLHIRGFPSKVKALAWTAGGDQLAVAAGPLITVWPCTGKKGPDGAKPEQLVGHAGDVSCLAFAPDSSLLASGGSEGMLLLWVPGKNKLPALLSRSHNPLTGLAWSPDGCRLACSTSGGDVEIITVFEQTNS